MKRFLTLLLSLTMILLGSFPVYAAPEWPVNIVIEAGGGIVMDANSGAVIYGKNLHETYFPASITKILTALIVVENCDMDEIVTFSHNAVYNVEAGSSSAGLDEGDQLTVRDTLYAMMLKSANEAANALAEHTAGSIEAFAEMMNERAKELGCQDSNFRNPSGLNDENHYTSPYDMAMIAMAAYQNEAFVEINSSLYYKLPPSKRNPEGFTVYPGHRMMKKNESVYYNGIIGGKTGYTSKAGNTLVTCAERNGMKLVTVVLDGHQTHYTDTKALLDFGFNNFKSLRISDYETAYTGIENDLTFANLPAADLSVLTFTKNSTITLPNIADFSDAVSSISYELDSLDPGQAAARIQYSYNDRKIGTAYLVRSPSPVIENRSEAANLQALGITEPENFDSVTEVPVTTAAKETPAPIDTTPFEIPPVFFKVVISIIVAAGLITGLIFWRIEAGKREAAARQLRAEKRRQRLNDIGISSSDFEQMVQQKRGVARVPQESLTDSK